MLAQAVFTQMYPVYRNLVIWLYDRLWLLLLWLLCLGKKKSSPDDGGNDTDELEKQSPSLQLRDMATPRMALPPRRRSERWENGGPRDLGVGLPPRRPVSLDRKTSEVGFGRGKHLHDEYAVKSKTPRAVKRVSLSTTTTTTTTYDVHINVDDVNDIESILVNIEAGRGRAKGVTPRGGGGGGGGRGGEAGIDTHTPIGRSLDTPVTPRVRRSSSSATPAAATAAVATSSSVTPRKSTNTSSTFGGLVLHTPPVDTPVAVRVKPLSSMRTPVGRSLDAPITPRRPLDRPVGRPAVHGGGRELGARQPSRQPQQEEHDQELSLRASQRKSGLDTPSSFFRASGGRVENL